MGSFYSTCSVSHMTLRGEKTSIQLLVPNFHKDFSDCLGMIVCDEGCQYFFSPFGFPIHGVYDDYGNISQIERDANVEMLEEFFNLSIEQIISHVGDDRWHKYGEKENDSSWTVKGIDGTSINNQELFLKMGMTYIRTEVLEFLHEGWENLDPEGKEVEKYSPTALIKDILTKLDKDPNQPSIREEHKERYNQLLDKLERDRETLTEKEIEEVEGTIELLKDLGKFNKPRTYIPTLVEYDMFSLLPINSRTFKEEIIKQYQFLINFGWRMNRTLLPSNYGSQDTNWNYLHKFNKFTNRLLDRNMNAELTEAISWYIGKDGKFDLEGFKEDHPYESHSDEQLKRIAESLDY